VCGCHRSVFLCLSLSLCVPAVHPRQFSPSSAPACCPRSASLQVPLSLSCKMSSVPTGMAARPQGLGNGGQWSPSPASHSLETQTPCSGGQGRDPQKQGRWAQQSESHLSGVGGGHQVPTPQVPIVTAWSNKVGRTPMGGVAPGDPKWHPVEGRGRREAWLGFGVQPISPAASIFYYIFVKSLALRTQMSF
jgi:hypothetical protein